MKIIKKTHERKLDLDTPISFSIDDIVNSLNPEDIFIINDLFLYTIKKDFSQIIFYLIVNDLCVSCIYLDVKTMNFTEEHTIEIYKSIIESEFDRNKFELMNLKNFVTM